MNQFIIDFFNTVSKEEVTNYLSANNCTLVKEFSKFENVYVITADSQPPMTDIVESVVADDAAPLTLLAKEFITYNLTAPENWWKVSSTNVQDFNAETVSHVLPDSKVNVYVLDSGAKLDHPEFEGVDIEYIFSYDGTFDDSNGHGTAIASVISGRTCSLTKMPIKVLKIFGSRPTMTSDLLNALEKVIEHSAASNLYGVVNLSWSIPKNEYIENKLRVLIGNGLPIICSAGNNGQPIENVTPACMPEVVTVGAYNENFEPCNFSNYTGQSNISVTPDAVNYGELDVWAPGQNIKVATLDGGYGVAAGTSISSAIHAAAVAYYIGDVEANISSVNDSLTDPAKLYYRINSDASNSLFTKNLLLLQDQYRFSHNRVTKFLSQMNIINDLGSLNNISKKLVLVKDSEFTRVVFFPKFVESYEIVGNKPEWLSFERGYAHGTARIDPNLTEQVYNFTLKVKTIDENYSPEMSILVSVIEDYPVKDENLEITLEFGEPNCSEPSCFDCTNIGDTCFTYEGCGIKQPGCFCADGCP